MASRPEKKDVGGLGDELAGGQLEDLLLRDLGVEAPVEILERLEAHELGRALAVLQMALFAHVELVLEDQLQKLAVVESVGGRLLKTDGKTAAEA
jgi:hypothetical protein